MKKKIVSLLLALALACGLMPAALAAGMDGFQRSQAYTAGQFTDVAAGSWYAGSVQSAYEFGLMKGSSATAFSPEGTLTLGEAVALAARIHSIYQTGQDSFVQGSPWYQVYVDYAAQNGIYSGTGDFNAPVPRRDFAVIIRNALPAAELPAINTIEDRSLPDVPSDAYYHDAVYALYRAGILTGNDAYGTFGPSTTITRASVAAIVTRMVDATQRQTLTLTANPVTLYAQDGRTLQVWPDEVNSYLTVGWSRTQPQKVTLYASGNRTIQVWPAEVDDYLAVGWSRTQIQQVTLYAWGDRSIQVWENEVDAYVAQGWSRTPVYTTVRNTPIRIHQQPQIHSINSADGVSFTIEWNNHSDKAIKYIHFYVTPYNRVWDRLTCDIRGYSTADCYVTGPIYKNTLNTDWSNDDYGNYVILVHAPADYPFPFSVDSAGRVTHAVYDDGSYSQADDSIPDASVTQGRLDDVLINTYWDCMWYNSEVAHLVIDRVYIEYMDGSTVNLTGTALSNCFY